MDLAFDLDPQTLRSAAVAALSDAKLAREAFLTLPREASPTAVVSGFDRIRRPLDAVRGPAHLLSQVHPTEALRSASQMVVQEIAAFDTELSLDRRVYERLSAVEASQLPGPEEKRLLEHALRDYRRSGVDRDDATRSRIKEISEELVRVGQTFDMNIARDTRRIELAGGARDLDGLPPDYVAAHAPAADGKVWISTDPTDYIPFLTYSRRSDLRRRLYMEHANRAAPANIEVLQRILALRHEMATLLGYAGWADYVTEDKMIRSAAAARAFVERTAALARPRLDAEVEELLEHKRRDDADATEIRDWERAFYVERVKSSKLGFDSQAVRPYFAFERVRDGVLATSAALYGVEFRRNRVPAVWHPKVECYDVVDHGEVVARFYLDMHPRPNKYKHAAMFDLRAGIVGQALPEAALVCNFPEPKGDDPALLLHQDVTTFFHEFGHLLHHLFAGRQRYLSFSGIATEWDFVEAPSQMYEEWAWDAGVLARFARHHRTDQPIPAELVARMRRAEEYGKGMQVSVQMFYAALSLALHSGDPAGLDPIQATIDWKRRMLPFPHEPGSHFVAAFGHLHGYSAIYYTYMWSLVIAKDLFSRFDGDLMNGATANEYRRNVLEPGGSRDAAELVRSFLGRDYADAAWERWLNNR